MVSRALGRCVSSTKWVRCGGSSRVFRSLFDTVTLSRSASRMITHRVPPSCGRKGIFSSTHSTRPTVISARSSDSGISSMRMLSGRAFAGARREDSPSSSSSFSSLSPRWMMNTSAKERDAMWRQCEHAPHASAAGSSRSRLGQLSAWARASATRSLPTPWGPLKRYALATRSRWIALRSSEIASV